jgi:hypothetical protein
MGKPHVTWVQAKNSYLAEALVPNHKPTCYINVMGENQVNNGHVTIDDVNETLVYDNYHYELNDITDLIKYGIFRMNSENVKDIEVRKVIIRSHEKPPFNLRDLIDNFVYT